MIDLAREQKDEAARIAFRTSGVATILAEGKGKVIQKVIKVSPDEAQRIERLVQVSGVTFSCLMRALIRQACDELGI